MHHTALRFAGVLLLSIAITAQAGCGRVHCMYHDDAPSANADLRSPTEADVFERYQPAEQRQREWEPYELSAAYGGVIHGPLYFEDPFEDKGAGRSDYRWGWEDYVALAYSPARQVLNAVAFPVSAVVTPPWTQMESDGELSRQLLGYDHDAVPLAQAKRAHTCKPDGRARARIYPSSAPANTGETVP